MLILARYIGEKIMIGDDISIEVVDAVPSRGSMVVKLGMTSTKFPDAAIVSPINIGERLGIGSDIYVEVIDAYPFRGRIQVKLGIQAPRTVAVHRSEIWEKIKNGENTQPGSDKQFEKQGDSFSQKSDSKDPTLV